MSGFLDRLQLRLNNALRDLQGAWVSFRYLYPRCSVRELLIIIICLIRDLRLWILLSQLLVLLLIWLTCRGNSP